MLRVSRPVGFLLASFIFVPVLVYQVARIVDPVAAQRWMNRYWNRFPEGTPLPEFLDPDVLAQSRARRILDRLGAVIFLGCLIMMLVTVFYFASGRS